MSEGQTNIVCLEMWFPEDTAPNEEMKNSNEESNKEISDPQWRMFWVSFCLLLRVGEVLGGHILQGCQCHKWQRLWTYPNWRAMTSKCNMKHYTGTFTGGENNSIKHIIGLIGKQMVDWLDKSINVKITQVDNYTVVMSLNAAVFRSKRLEGVRGWEIPRERGENK